MAGTLMVVLLTMYGQYIAVTAAGCTNSPMDINFLLDSSDDTQAVLFDQQKLFTSNLINELWDGKNQFGLFTFGNNVYSQFHLDTYTSPSEIQQAITYVWKATGKADVASALEYTIKHAFRDSNGGRDVAPDVVFLMTSSDIRNETRINSIIGQLQASEIELYVVIVGEHISQYWYEKLTFVNKITRIRDASALAAIAGNTKRTLCRGRGILRLWTTWSACGAPCGLGLKRRTRTCEKRNPDDDDCDGSLLDEQECLSPVCLGKVDGVWSNWGKWSDCSKTCGSGMRSRLRTCSAPFPKNGGKTCVGASDQKQNCSVWACPDCNKKCPSGSHLANECDVCICSDVVLHGSVLTSKGHPINDASIYISSKLYAPLAKTDYTGAFSVADICIMGETVTVKQTGYLPMSLAPKVVNMTHWFINATLKELVTPVFITHPEDKTRLVGQSVTLCCLAVGSPVPDKYSWFKGKDIIDSKGENGTLTIDSVRLDDSGKYRCLTETNAGSFTSNVAILTVSDGPTDSCASPVSFLQDLPDGCYVKGDVRKNSTFDVRTCGKAPCVSRDLHDNGTCAEWWSFHCCDAAEKELVDIQCDGFSYKTSRVKTCKCQKCFSKTIVTGKAFGRLENGSEVPLKLGNVYGFGKKLSRTNMKGVFSFEVPRRITRLVLKFSDDVFNTFLDCTKIVSIVPGSSTAVKLALPLRPAPRAFDSDSDLHIEVGGSGDLEPTGRISISKNSLVSSKGTPYVGPAKAFVHYMDPRKLHDFEAANGEFVYHEDGDLLPLETVGVFTSEFEDETGNPLYTIKPFSFEFDPAVFNISANADGEPKVELWRMNENSGTWVEAGKMKYQTSGQRRLLRDIIVGTEDTAVNIPQINLYDPVYETKTVTVYENVRREVRMYNGDMKVYYEKQPRPKTITQRLPDKAKRNACYISVMVYKTFSGKQPVVGTQVTAVTQSPNTNAYIGFDRKPTDENGHVCLSTFCDSVVFLSAENRNDLSQLQAFPNHDVPLGYDVSNIRNGTQVRLVSSNTLDVMTDSGRRFSPVYYAEDEEGNDLQRCLNGFNDDFKFQFGQSVTEEPNLDLTQPENEYDNKLSWYPIPPDYINRQVCFFKTLIKIRENYNLRFIATSYQGSIAGDQYGTYNVGPLPESTYSDMINRAACIEFRCPGLVNDGTTVIRNVTTFLEVRVNPNSQAQNCRFRSLAKGLPVFELLGGKGFQARLRPDTIYGPKFGVYIATDSREVVERFCSQGKDTGSLDIGMNPLLNAAVEYDCT